MHVFYDVQKMLCGKGAMGNEQWAMGNSE